MSIVPRLLSTLGLSVLVSCSSQDRSCVNDRQVVLRAEAVTEAFKRADAPAIVDMMYPTVVKAAGGRDKYIAVAEEAMTEMSAKGLMIDHYTIGQPTKTYRAGDKFVCFFPSEMIASRKEVRLRSLGYLVAVYDRKASTEWTFLDSTAFRKNPSLLREIFPELPAGVQTPPTGIERLQ